MTPRHHLHESTLVSHAAGAIPPEQSAVVEIHLQGCPVCRAALADAERVGGCLLEELSDHAHPLPPEAHQAQLRMAMLERLDSAIPQAAPAAGARPVAMDEDLLPTPLHPYFGSSYRALKWRWIAPGMGFIRKTGPSGGTLVMLRVGPGKRLPVHSHGGTEITQILRGAYDDVLGHFAVGDAADLANDIEHQPVTSPGGDCICVAAMDTQLRFSGWLARALQPIYGI